MPKNKLLRNEKLKEITLERAEKFVSKDYWKDVNLYSILYKERRSDCVKLSVYSVPDTDVNHTDKVSYEEAMKQEFVPVELGKSYGPSWSSHWFKGSRFSV
jgi:alpha-mannosidase